MTYVSPAWEFAAVTHLMKLQRLQIKVLSTTGNYTKSTPFRDILKTFKHLYVYDYVKNYAGNKQQLYKIMIMKMFAAMTKAKTDTKNIRGLNLVAVKHMIVQVTRLPL
jgi:hypothetical protein